MLLHVLCRPGGALLAVSPILLCGAAIPGAGFLMFVALGLMGLGTGGGALWAFFGFCLFLLGVAAYAFLQAAWSQQVRCRREGQRVHVTKRGAQHEADAGAVVLAVETRTVGLQAKVTLHEVTLNAPGWRDAVTVHSGLTPWAAARAAVRVSEHIGVSYRRPL